MNRTDKRVIQNLLPQSEAIKVRLKKILDAEENILYSAQNQLQDDDVCDAIRLSISHVEIAIGALDEAISSVEEAVL